MDREKPNHKLVFELCTLLKGTVISNWAVISGFGVSHLASRGLRGGSDSINDQILLSRSYNKKHKLEEV